MSLVPSLTEIIFTLGAGDSVVGITYHSTYPPELSERKIIGGYFEPSVETIADLNPDIPYSLLAFYPQFYLTDLPVTSQTHAVRCREIANRAGVKNVHIGNIHLLGSDYP